MINLINYELELDEDGLPELEEIRFLFEYLTEDLGLEPGAVKLAMVLQYDIPIEILNEVLEED